MRRLFLIAGVVCAISQGSGAPDKLSILLDILASGNDNDPRLDRELRHLERGEKKQFAEVYVRLPFLHRNGKGLVAFLIGRETREKSDIRFLRFVLTDRVPATGRTGGFPALAVTAAYPQLVALKALERCVVEKPRLRNFACRSIVSGMRSESALVRARSKDAIERHAECRPFTLRGRQASHSPHG